LIYWWGDTKQQNETTIPVPNSLYAVTKLHGMHLGNWFAEKYNLQIVNAILYNHESQLRSPNFISMKIIQWAIKISQWLQDKITLGDLSTQVDRWDAIDYVEAMHMCLQTSRSSDYIISSGSLHTVKDFVGITFWYLWLNRKNYVIEDKSILIRKNSTLFW